MRGLLSVVVAALIGFVLGAFALTGHAQQQQQPPALSLLPCAHAWVLYRQAEDSVLMSVHLVNTWFALAAYQQEQECWDARTRIETSIRQQAPNLGGKYSFSCFPDNYDPNPRPR